jgi:hypothetical protein
MNIPAEAIKGNYFPSFKGKEVRWTECFHSSGKTVDFFHFLFYIQIVIQPSPAGYLLICPSPKIGEFSIHLLVFYPASRPIEVIADSTSFFIVFT